jgi:hypothetical protein
MKNLFAGPWAKPIGYLLISLMLIGLQIVNPAQAKAQDVAAKADSLEVRISVDEATPFCAGKITWDQVRWYHIDLLRLAARFSQMPFTITPVCRDHPTEDGRMAMLRDGSTINLAFFATNSARELDLLAVYFPVYLGTTGLRLFFTRTDIETDLKNVHTLSDLQKFTFGQERRWPDTAILEFNGMRVVDARYPYLHNMLMAGRFELYPRAYWQAFSELDQMQQTAPDIVLATDVALYYPLPIYFFVSPDQSEMHDAILDGLTRAHATGKVLELLRTHPQTSAAFEKAPLEGLRVINLLNPNLSDQSRAALARFGIAHHLERHPRQDRATAIPEDGSSKQAAQ